jgi:hypothetical protein
VAAHPPLASRREDRHIRPLSCQPHFFYVGGAGADQGFRHGLDLHEPEELLGRKLADRCRRTDGGNVVGRTMSRLQISTSATRISPPSTFYFVMVRIHASDKVHHLIILPPRKTLEYGNTTRNLCRITKHPSYNMVTIARRDLLI